MRITSLSLVLALTAACGPVDLEATLPYRARAIIGGNAIDAATHPTAGAILGMAQSQFGPIGGFVCSGTLIARDVVLTAGHCLEGPPADVAESFDLYFSLSADVTAYGQGGGPQQPPDFALPARTVRAARLISHPGWQGTEAWGQIPPSGLGSYDDIALLILEEPFDEVTPSPILRPAQAGALAPGAPLTIVGYGNTTPQQSQQSTAGVKYLATSELIEVGDDSLRVGDGLPTPQKCNGDSGGPSFLQVEGAYRVVGLTNRGWDGQNTTCEDGGIDVRVDVYASWIDEVIAEHSGSTPPETPPESTPPETTPPSPPPNPNNPNAGPAEPVDEPALDDTVHEDCEPEVVYINQSCGQSSGSAPLWLSLLAVGIAWRARRRRG